MFLLLYYIYLSNSLKEVNTWKGGFPGSAGGKEPACQRGRLKRCRLDPWLGRLLGGGNGNPLQYSENANLRFTVERLLVLAGQMHHYRKQSTSPVIWEHQRASGSALPLPIPALRVEMPTLACAVPPGVSFLRLWCLNFSMLSILSRSASAVACSCSILAVLCEIQLCDQGSNPGFLHWSGESATGHQGRGSHGSLQASLMDRLLPVFRKGFRKHLCPCSNSIAVALSRALRPVLKQFLLAPPYRQEVRCPPLLLPPLACWSPTSVNLKWTKTEMWSLFALLWKKVARGLLGVFGSHAVNATCLMSPMGCMLLYSC